jgi:hypothetical protein
MISARHTPLLGAVLALALIPTLIHSYAGATAVDGRTTASIPVVLAGLTSTPARRDDTWGSRRFESDDWFERNYIAGTERVTLTVARSYDLKSLYHHPELAIADNLSFERVELRRFDEHPDVVVHWLVPSPGVTARAMYVLHYDDRYIEDPIWFQLRTAGELLFSRRQAMTLLFARQVDVAEAADDQALPATRLLLAAVDAFTGASAAAPAR